ncbi:hypothetical protein A0X89_04160 [Campylobacter coli]|nr:hypothetical protein [Campylobacter coli]EHD2721148.1 hypothetical protein [Campylobacter coli]EIN8285370.1 hypothetical protein [Campylobacter coli]
MVFITVQGANKEGQSESVKNGKKIIGDEEQKEIYTLLQFINKNRINTYNENCIKRRGYNFCTILHPIKDEKGRNRMAWVIWDKFSSDEELKNSIELMGLSYEKFKTIAKHKKNKIFTIILFVIILLIIFIMFLQIN